MLDLYLSLGAIALLLFLSAFFSGSETALTAASRGVMHRKEIEGDWRARIVNRLRRRKDRLIGAILLGNNLVNILASALATSVLIGLVGDAGVLYATVIMTLLVLIFSEVLPKTYAIHRAETAALATAPVIRLVVWGLAPITAAVTRIVALLLRPFGTNFGHVTAGPDIEELRGAIELHKEHSDEGEETEEIRHERNMLRSILDLANTDVDEVMTHRSAMVMLDADQPAEAVVEAVLDSPFTRLPLYRTGPDNIIGIIHAKALLREVRREDADLAALDVATIAAKPWFIPDTTSLLDQLQEFQARHEHFALVVDEYGAVMGLITLEDILEEIVGDIADEHDISVAGVRPQPDGSYLLEGTVTLRDLNREYEWGLPSNSYATLAGLVLHEARRIPEVGQTYAFYEFRFEILRRHGNRITLIRVTPPGAGRARKRGAMASRSERGAAAENDRRA